jgi:hypothetical protein
MLSDTVDGGYLNDLVDLKICMNAGRLLRVPPLAELGVRSLIVPLRVELKTLVLRVVG